MLLRFGFSEVCFGILVQFVIPLMLYCFLPLYTLQPIYWVLTGIFIATSIWLAVETIGGCTCSQKHHAAVEGLKISLRETSVLIIIPAYLDTEQMVLKDTLAAYSRQQFDGELTVMVVYNCRSKDKTRDFELYLLSEWDGKEINGIHFQIFENELGTSKAENVNYVLDMPKAAHFDYIGVSDADHEPGPDNISQGVHCFEMYDCDIVQGQWAIRDTADCFLARIVAMEFTKMYNIGHEGRTACFNLGILGGSNGLWKSTLLRKTLFDKEMLTEDIDAIFRAILAGAKIVYCSTMVSYELDPVAWTNMVNRRHRWAQGWFEIFLKYCCGMETETNCSWPWHKMGSFFLLFWRAIFVAIFYHPLFLVLAYLIRAELTAPTVVQWTLIGAAMIIALCKSAFIYPMTNAKLRRTLPKYWFLLYILYYPFYSAFLNFVKVTSHWRHFTSQTAWISTPRDCTAGINGSASAQNSMKVAVDDPPLDSMSLPADPEPRTYGTPKIGERVPPPVSVDQKMATNWFAFITGYYDNDTLKFKEYSVEKINEFKKNILIIGFCLDAFCDELIRGSCPTASSAFFLPSFYIVLKILWITTGRRF